MWAQQAAVDFDQAGVAKAKAGEVAGASHLSKAPCVHNRGIDSRTEPISKVFLTGSTVSAGQVWSGREVTVVVAGLPFQPPVTRGISSD